MSLSNFYNTHTKNTLSTVESVMGKVASYDNITELVFVNKYTRDLGSFEYNFAVTRHAIFFEVKREYLLSFMWRFRMTRNEITQQLRKQFDHSPELGIILTTVNEY